MLDDVSIRTLELSVPSTGWQKVSTQREYECRCDFEFVDEVMECTFREAELVGVSGDRCCFISDEKPIHETDDTYQTHIGEQIY